MDLPIPNPLRGEAEVTLARGGRFILAATMDDIARFSQAANCATMDEMFKRLTHGEAAASLIGLRLFAVRAYIPDEQGKEIAVVNPAMVSAQAAARWSLSDTDTLAVAFVAIMEGLVVHRPAKPGEGGGVGEKVNPPNAGSASTS